MVFMAPALQLVGTMRSGNPSQWDDERKRIALTFLFEAMLNMIPRVGSGRPLAEVRDEHARLMKLGESVRGEDPDERPSQSVRRLDAILDNEEKENE